MGRAPCCDKANVKRGPWSPEEDAKLKDHIDKHGTGGNWIAFPQKAGLRRCGKSCRLRWLNYLRPNIKHGEFSDDEDRIICTLFANIGSRWSVIAAQLPGRTDNDIKNYWNTKLKKKLMGLHLLPPHAKLPFHHQQPTNYHSLLQSCSPSNSLLSYSNNNSSSSSLSLHPSSPSSSSSPPPPPLPVYPFKSNHGNCGLIRPLISTDQLTMISSSSPSLSITGTSFNSAIQQQQQHYRKQVNDGVLMRFGSGGTEANCSSSDGTASFEYEAQGQQQLVQMSSFHQQGTNNNSSSSSSNIIDHYYYGTTRFSTRHDYNNKMEDYGFEEIKQLVTTNTCNNSSLLLF